MSEGEPKASLSGSGAEVIDLAEQRRWRERSSSSSHLERIAFTLFLVVARRPDPQDHDLYYVFLEGAPTMVAAATFVRDHALLFGVDTALVDLHQPFENAGEVVEMARRLKGTAPGATVLAPELGLGPRLAGNG